MKIFSSILCVCFTLLLVACENPPSMKDVIGTWVNPDGAELKLEPNGKFTTHSLPAAIFLWHDQIGSFGGSGIWELIYNNPYWEVKLSFDILSERPARQGVPVLVSGSGDSTYLYRWVRDEGENKYELHKSSTIKH